MTGAQSNLTKSRIAAADGRRTVQSYSPGGANVPDRAHWGSAHCDLLANTIQLVLCPHKSTTQIGSAVFAQLIENIGATWRRRMNKTVPPILSDRCPAGCLSCLSVCLSVTLVYCGQTVGRIKMKLSMQVGLGPIILCYIGTQLPLPPKKGNKSLLTSP